MQVLRPVTSASNLLENIQTSDFIININNQVYNQPNTYQIDELQ